MRCAEEIKGELYLGEESIPLENQEIWWTWKQSSKKVIFNANGTFSRITAMYVIGGDNSNANVCLIISLFKSW